MKIKTGHKDSRKQLGVNLVECILLIALVAVVGAPMLAILGTTLKCIFENSAHGVAGTVQADCDEHA